MSKLLSSKSISLANELIADGYELQSNEYNRNTLILIKDNTTIKLLPTLKTNNLCQNKN